jgi:hypothetical protein
MAIYARGAAAVEEERKIKENELNTDITLEEQRRRLIELQGENGLREAESRGRALEEETHHRAAAKQFKLDVFGESDVSWSPRARTGWSAMWPNIWKASLL